MEEDYYTVMKGRISYFSQKYDPHNRYPLEWEEKRNEPILTVSGKVKKTDHRQNNSKRAIVLKSITSFIMLLVVCFYKKIIN